MKISFAPEMVTRYRDLIRLFFKYGRSELLAGGFEDPFSHEEAGISPEANRGEELAKDLQRMGPVYIKMGQLLSSRGDVLPEDFIAPLARLRDKLDPFSFGEVEQIIKEELGVRISKAFESFEVVPIGAASLGQVHRAVLKGGRTVVVKVQRPGIRAQIHKDMEALGDLASLLSAHTSLGRRFQLPSLLEQFRKTLMLELDYRQEARNLRLIGANLRDFEKITVPEPVEDYTTSRVLTMDFIAGRKMNEVGPLTSLSVDMGALAQELFRAYLKQVLVDGVFHADPHPGNILVTGNTNVRPLNGDKPSIKLALIDLGMVGQLSPDLREQLLKLLVAIADGKADEAANVAIQIGEPLANFNESGFRAHIAELVTRHQSIIVGEIKMGRLLLNYAHSAASSGINVPPQLAMVSKTLLNLDEIGQILCPRFNVNRAIQEYVGEVFRKRVVQSLSFGSILTAFLETKEFAQKLPIRTNRILDLLSRNKLKIEVDALDEQLLVEGFQKVANRIATGLVLAALIVGAALLMNIKTEFTIAGYPGLAMLLFFAAAAGGVYLVVTTFLADRSTHKKG